MSAIEWKHDGRRIVLPILLLPPEPVFDLTGTEAQALVDTGATSSGITPRMARRLGLKSYGKRPLGSAHGEAQADRYLFRIGIRKSEDQLPFVFEEIDGFGLTDSFKLDAILGMDILRYCDFTIDRHRRCSLSFGYD